MKRLIFASAVIVAALYNQTGHAAAPAECFANSGAVFSAHPNASHASYIVHEKKSGGSARCWYADAFKTQTKADAKPATRSVAPVAETSALRPSITTPARQPRTTAVAAPAIATPAQPRTTAVAPAAQFPGEIQPPVQMAVNKQELTGFLPVDETPADFESRFSASGYKARK
jgi:hypothetical protein